MSKKIGQEFKVRLGPECSARLRALAARQGFTVAELVRFCIEHTLPALEKKYTDTNPDITPG